MEYFDEGQGEPIILIHGWLVAKEIFLLLTWGLLAANFRVIAPDMPGFGNSEELSVPHSPENYAIFLGKFAEKLGLAKFNLFGCSMGGTIALAFAIRNKEKIRKLVVQAPFFYGRQTWFDRKARLLVSLAERSKTVRELAYRMAWNQYQSRKEDIFGSIPNKYHPAISRIIESCEYEFKNTMSKKAAEEIGKYTTEIDFRPLLKGLDTETLIIIGEKDRVIKLKDMRLLNRLLPNSRLWIAPEATHYALVEIPDKFCQAVVDFLK